MFAASSHRPKSNIWLQRSIVSNSALESRNYHSCCKSLQAAVVLSGWIGLSKGWSIFSIWRYPRAPQKSLISSVNVTSCQIRLFVFPPLQTKVFGPKLLGHLGLARPVVAGVDKKKTGILVIYSQVGLLQPERQPREAAFLSFFFVARLVNFKRDASS